MEAAEFLIISGVFAFGLLGSSIYYIARFILFPDSKDGEFQQSLDQKKAPQVQKKSQVTEKAPAAKKQKTKSLQEALSKSKRGLWFSKSVDQKELSSLDELEESLYMADMGPQTVSYLIDQVKEKKAKEFDLEEIKGLFKQEILELFEEGESEKVFKRTLEGSESGPYVISVVGVNGAGKTTSIGKLAYKFLKEGKKVMVAAGDTFRAAAENQLGVWAERSEALIFKAPPNTTDPGAVAFQAYEKAKKEQVDILLIDTAGRLHTQDNLMKELEKVQRVLKKHDEKAPQEVWMVVDANTGMNALFQAESFNKSLGLTAVIMTKVDGTAKAGTAIGIRRSLNVPILMLGVGEGIEDLKLFEREAFASSLV